MCILGSGSGGNCTAVWTQRTRLLIDAGGLSAEYIQEKLGQLRLARLDAVLITHAHGDHVGRTTYDLLGDSATCLYCDKTTWKTASGKYERLRDLERGRPKRPRFFGRDSFRIGDLTVRPFSVPHEGHAQHTGSWRNDHSGSPVGFVIGHRRNGKSSSIGYATDLGSVPAKVVDHLAEVDLLVIEANHDERMVREKAPREGRWLISDFGHLNNYDAGWTIVKILQRRRQKPLRVFLAHLSSRHNTKARAIQQVRTILKRADVKLAGLGVADQYRRTRVVKVEN